MPLGPFAVDWHRRMPASSRFDHLLDDGRDTMNQRLLGFNVAVAKENFETAVEHWSNVFGVTPNFMKPGDFAVPGIRGASLQIGDSLIYILAGENEKVPVAQFVANRGEGVFLVSFEVENV